MRLNRTNAFWDRETRNGINDNWDIIEGNSRKLENDFKNVVDSITDEVVDQLVDSAKLDWKDPVDTYNDLPANAEVGETRMVRDIGKVYRFNGSAWKEIQQIDAGPVNEVDTRLTAQLADVEKQRFYTSMVNKKKRRGMIIWTDDDGRQGFYTKLAPLAKEYNIPMTCAYITKYYDNPPERTLTPEQLKDLRDNYGIEIVSHTHNHDVNHRLEDMTDEELHADFSQSQKIIKEGGFNYRGVVFPFGTYIQRPEDHKRIMDIARQYFDYAISTGNPQDGRMTGTAQVPPINNYDIRRVTLERGFSYVKEAIDKGSEEDGLVVLIGHVDAGIEGWFTEAYARQVIEYALSKGMEFVTTEEAINAHGNIAQFGETRITPDGTIFSNELGKVRYMSGSNISPETPVTAFYEEAITICTINSANAAAKGFPNGYAGVLETHRITEEVYSYQRYTTSRDKRFYIRHWDHNNNLWTEWIADNVAQYLGINAMTPSTPPTAGPQLRKVSYTTINSQGNAGFPENRSGTLTTYALHGEGFQWQEYSLYQSNRVYKRFWNNSESKWEDWFVISDVVRAHRIADNLVTASRKPSEFEIGITLSYTSKAGDTTGFPNNDSGTLTTYKSSTTDEGRTYQEFKSYNNWDKYIRYATSSSTWSGWKKFMVK